MPIPFSRSSLETYHDCPRKWWYAYAYPNGTPAGGLEGVYPPMELWVGVSIHDGIAKVIKMYLDSNTPGELAFNPANIDLVAAGSRLFFLAPYVEEGQPIHPEHEEFSWLVYGLIYAWSRLILPEFMAEYEVLSIEKELQLELPHDVVLQGRTDLILRHRLTKVPYVHNFKSTQYADSEFWGRKFLTDMQLSSELLLAEKDLGEKCGGVIIEAMSTGSKRYAKDEDGNEYRYQATPLLYGYYRAPNPPVAAEAFEWKYERARGKQWQKIKTWGSPEGVRNWIEHWLINEPDMLRAQFKRLAPILRDVVVVEDWIEQAVIQVLQVEKGASITTLNINNPQAYRQALNVHFPQHTKTCDEYRNGCMFKDICWKNHGVNPLKLSIYRPRTPNHPELNGGE